MCGVGGQDGAYLAALPAGQGLRGGGTSRDAPTRQPRRPARAGHRRAQVRVVSMDAQRLPQRAAAVTRSEPDEIYNLAGQSSVGLSFEQPVETLESIASARSTCSRRSASSTGRSRFYNASSSECFGDTGDDRGQRRHAVPPAQPLRRGQGRRAVPGGQLPRGLRHASPAPASCSTTNRRCGRRAS